MLFDAKLIELIHQKALDFVKTLPHSLEILLPILASLKNHTTGNSFTVSTNVIPFSGQYTAIGVDGSQIYPDRHSSISYFLLHVGTILIEYGKTNGIVTKEGHPCLFSSWDTFQDTVHTHDIVDAERFLHELHSGFLAAREYQKKSNSPFVICIDGPLLFWHLRQKPAPFVALFSGRYQKILHEYKQYNIPVIGYISKPGSRELITYLKQHANQEALQTTEIQQLLSSITDTTLLSLFLPQDHQTDLFLSQTQFATQHTEDIYFYYYNIGSEYARIELPAWIVDNKKMCSFVFGAIKQQIQNGFGYPTVLGLAHELSVIKNKDRLFFYTLLHKTLQQYGAKTQTSRKQAKKDAGNSVKPYL